MGILSEIIIPTIGPALEVIAFLTTAKVVADYTVTVIPDIGDTVWDLLNGRTGVGDVAEGIRDDVISKAKSDDKVKSDDKGKRDNKDKIKTPDSHPDEFMKLKGNQGYKDKEGNIWKKDKLHKDHWDISNRRGEKIREVDFNGDKIWPNGPKNKNKRPF